MEPVAIIEQILTTIAKYYNQYIPPYLSVEFQGKTFQRFDASHAIVLAITFILTLLIILTRNKLSRENKDSLSEVMAQILIINEIAWYLWQYFYAELPLKEMLPLHPINILAWISAFMLLRKNKILYELVYFLGTLSSLYLLFTPNVGIYGFPHYRFFYALITPTIIFLSAIYMTFAEEEIRPQWISLLRTFLIANIIIALIYGINFYLGSNFLYLNAKPNSTLIPFPDAPLHILYYEGIGIAVSLLLYLPFLIWDWWRNRGLKDTSRLNDYSF